VVIVAILDQYKKSFPGCLLNFWMQMQSDYAPTCLALYVIFRQAVLHTWTDAQAVVVDFRHR
jgi:hypothetical protein